MKKISVFNGIRVYGGIIGIGIRAGYVTAEEEEYVTQYESVTD